MAAIAVFSRSVAPLKVNRVRRDLFRVVYANYYFSAFRGSRVPRVVKFWFEACSFIFLKNSSKLFKLL